MLKPSFKRLSQLETDAWHQVSTEVAVFWCVVDALKAIRWQLQNTITLLVICHMLL